MLFFILLVIVMLAAPSLSAAEFTPNVRYTFPVSAGRDCIELDPNSASSATWVADITNLGGGHFYVEKAVFHDRYAGCRATTSNLNQDLFKMSGQTDYPNGAHGQTTFVYDTTKISCGRVQVDGGFRDDNNGNLVFLGVVINYGVDCPSGPVIDYVTPTVVNNCGSVLEIYGIDLTNVVQFFDSGGNRFTVVGQVNDDNTHIIVTIPSELPGGQTRVRIYSSGQVSNEKVIAVTSCSSVPVIDFVSPTVISKCGGILEIHGRYLTNVVQFFDESGNRHTVVGTVNSEKTLTAISIPAEVPAGQTRVRIYAAADRISNEKIITVQSCNSPPVISSCSAPSSATLNNPVTITYSVSDPDNDAVTISVNWGDGTSSTGSSSSATHTYTSTGTFSVTITATDSKGASSSRSCGTITITPTANLPPTISSCSPSSSTVSPGGTVGINYAISDPNGDAFSATVNWGDGTITSGGQSSATHVYYAPGTYKVTITATDSKGASSSRSCGTITVSSSNSPPTISSCNTPSMAVVGTTATIIYSVTDPDGDSFSVTVNWGDGTSSSGGQSSASHVYTGTGTFSVTITATDSKGASSSRSCGTITVTPTGGNNPPTISSCNTPSAVFLGSTATISYSVSDPDGDTFSVAVNWGDGSSSSGGPFSAAHIYLAAGTYFVTVTATDSRGASASRFCGTITANSIIILANNPPVISSCNSPSTATVGTTATANYAISDPDGDSFTVMVNWGDGTSSTGSSSSATHTYTSTGTFSVTITATDSKGASSSRSCGTITVTPTGGNNPPTISSCTAPSTATVGTTATANYAITDSDGDTFSVTVNWGDGTTSSGGTSSASHVYSSAGTFTITITATDSRGASASRNCGTITVSLVSTPSGDSKLKIIDVSAKVDGRTSSGLTDGERISRRAGPESKVDFKIKTRNIFPTAGGLTIRDIIVKTTIESIDNGDDLEDESSDFDLRPQSDKTVTLNNYNLPLNVDEGDYNVHIEAEGEDENGVTQRDELNIVLEVEKDKHDLRFTKLTANKARINCNEGFSLNYQIMNLGREDEEKSYVEITSDELGIDSFQRDITVQSGTDGNTYSRIVPLRVTNNVEDGIYSLAVNVYSDDGTLQDSRAVQMNVQGCGGIRQINQTTTTGTSSSSSNLYGTETIERTIQIPFIQLFFRGAGGGWFWILISTLILSIFFVLAAIILMVRSDEE